MQFYENINAVQTAYLTKALAGETPTQVVKIGNSIKAYSACQGEFKYAENCKVEVTGRVANRYIKNGKVQDEAPILITSDTGDFLGGEKHLYCFTTSDLGEDNLKPTSIVSGGLLKTWSEVTFKAGHNFMIKSKPVTVPLYKSVIDGQLYEDASLPEQDQANCLTKYTSEVKAERNARLSDTDIYVQVIDMTVKKSADKQRSALTESELDVIKQYRTELRNLPEQEGFPFVSMPTIPDCVAIEAQAKIDQRNSMENMR